MIRSLSAHTPEPHGVPGLALLQRHRRRTSSFRRREMSSQAQEQDIREAHQKTQKNRNKLGYRLFCLKAEAEASF